MDLFLPLYYLKGRDTRIYLLEHQGRLDNNHQVDNLEIINQL